MFSRSAGAGTLAISASNGTLMASVPWTAPATIAEVGLGATTAAEAMGAIAVTSLLAGAYDFGAFVGSMATATGQKLGQLGN